MAQINQEILGTKSEIQKQQLQNQYDVFLKKYNNDLVLIKNYEQDVLPEAKLIANSANKQFFNGEINFLEWSVLMNQTQEVKINYLNTIKSYNDNIIQVLYFKS